MAAIEQRRVMSRAEAKFRRPVRFPATVSPVGWAFALLAMGQFVIRVQPLLAPGALDAPRWGDDARLLVDAVGEAAIIGLPAALALGFPAAPSRNRWLVRGVVLLALAPLASMAVSWFRERIIEIADPSALFAFDPSTPLGLGLAVLSLSTMLITIAGAWSLSDGLDEAGATLTRGVLVLAGSAGVAVVLAAYGGYVVGIELELATFALSVVGLVLSAIVLALWFVIAARLAVGWVDGLAPRVAWVVGTVAGVLLVGRFVASAVIGLTGGFEGDDGRLVVLSLISPTAWILLFAAFALGLGRGWPFRRRGYRLGPAEGE
ncbi:MAG: hypothetical protein AB1627_12155 [Chloroflexota bacterium]